MKEKGGGGEIDAEMERLPKMAAQPKANVRSDHYEPEDIEGDGPDGVFKRLARGMDRIDEIEQAKPRVLVQEQNCRMQERRGKSDVARPVVQSKIVEPAMRPRTMRAVPEGHEHPEEEVQGDDANGSESDIGGKVEDSEAHWQK